MALKTYDFKKVAVIINGNIISGFAEGSSIKVERQNPGWNLQIGADGEGVRSKSNDASGKITLTLQQGADSNKILSTLAQADEVSGSGVFAALIKDGSPNGNSLHSAEQAFIQKISDAEYSKDAGTREWVILTDKLISFVGSN